MIHKRSLLFLIAFLLVASMALVGCLGGETTTEPTDENGLEEESIEANEPGEDNDTGGADVVEVDPADITEFSQSPILDDEDLPAVEDRLPSVPKITNELAPEQLDYEIGQYGGTLRTASNEVDYDADVFVMLNEPLINTPGILGEEFTANIVEDFEVSEDQQEFTFYMREGLKWSDGEPVTSEDVRFTVEDVLFNEELTPVFPAWLRSEGSNDGEPMEFEQIDEYTFKISFDQPYGGFLARVSIQGWRGYQELLKPAHYLKDYHIDYTPIEELEPLIEEENLDSDDWEQLFGLKDILNSELTSSDAIGFPVLTPWMIVSRQDELARFERNPYYFKVDPEGNQLPYIDEINSRLVEDMEMMGIETISGNIDFSREATALNRMPLYRENEENGGYKAKLMEMHITPSDVQLNLTYEDETWQEVVQDVRFREALSLALDNEEIVDAIYYGFAEPTTIQDAVYDPEEANRLLDEMGMEIGSDGYRQAPSGENFMIDIEIGDFAPDFIPLTELVVQYWSDLDLNVNMRTIDRGLWGDRNAANELMATMMWTHTPLWHNGDWGQIMWAPLWISWWNTGGSEGEEPPEEVKHFYGLLDKISTSPPEEAMEAVEEIRDELGEHYWYFVHIESVQQPMIVNENLGNIPEEGEALAIAVNFSAEQFFFRE